MPSSVRRTIIILCVIAAAAGMWLGVQVNDVTESDAIELAAARYEAETGDSNRTCVAVPGHSADVWIEVRCGLGPVTKRYSLNRRGQFVENPIEPDA